MIRLIIILVILILILSYFNVDIQTIAESQQSQNNFSYVVNLVKSTFNKYLKEPINYFWKEIFIKLLWNSFVSNMERIRDGQPTDLELMAPRVNYEFEDLYPNNQLQNNLVPVQ